MGILFDEARRQAAAQAAADAKNAAYRAEQDRQKREREAEGRQMADEFLSWVRSAALQPDCQLYTVHSISYMSTGRWSEPEEVSREPYSMCFVIQGGNPAELGYYLSPTGERLVPDRWTGEEIPAQDGWFKRHVPRSRPHTQTWKAEPVDGGYWFQAGDGDGSSYDTESLKQAMIGYLRRRGAWFPNR